MIVIGCSSKPKVSADETTKMLFDFYIKGNKESLSKIKISKEQIEEVSKMQKDKTIAKIKTNFTSEGLKISDEQANQIYAARVAALKKLSGKTEVISQDDKSAQVKLKVTYFDEVALDKKAGIDTVEEVGKMNLTDRQEAINKAKDIYIKNLIKSYGSVKPSSDMKEQTFKLTIKEQTWMPEDMKNFGESIVKLTSGIK